MTNIVRNMGKQIVNIKKKLLIHWRKGLKKEGAKKVKVNSEKSDLHPKVILYSLVCTFPPKSLNLITLALERV